ncbi:hypothetical protein LUZ60_012542 [Juncus effusus]|nr:hypothetical protein LUZ60_012542 [Juncus effusus]
MASHSLLSCPSISLSVPNLSTFSPTSLSLRAYAQPKLRLRVQAETASFEPVQAEATGEEVVPEPVEAQIDELSSEEKKKQDVYAVVMIGSRQYIVYPGRFLTLQRLKGANVDDKIILNKVLFVGTRTKDYIGQPVVTNAAVHAVVEEQGRDKKVIIFKYKKKKNYRRKIGHRQPNTRIRILGITGYEDFE